MIAKSVTQHSILDSTFSFVCVKSGLSEQLVSSKTRKGEVVRVRQVFYYLIRKYFKNTMSLTLTGSFFKQDHATVLHAVRVVSNLNETDKQFSKWLKEIEEEYELTTVDAMRRRSKYKMPKTMYLQVKQEAQFEVERANLMYYEALKLIGKVNDHLLKDNVMEGFRKKKLTDELTEYKTRISQLKLEKLV